MRIKLRMRWFFDVSKVKESSFFKSKRVRVNSQAVGWDSLMPTALKSISSGTLFLNQLHDFSLISSNSFLHPFLKSKFAKKILDAKKISFSKADFYKATDS